MLKRLSLRSFPTGPLRPDEVREMLLPTLDALAFLHRKNLVQGQLKPPNVLVVNDQVKLASDTIRPAGESTASIAKSSLYDPPEAKDGRISAAGDIWALGITMVEALTQCPPAWPDERSETASLPASLPPTFVETVRRCLSRNPADRPTVTELEAQFKRAPQAPVVSIPQSVVREATGPSRCSTEVAQTALVRSDYRGAPHNIGGSLDWLAPVSEQPQLPATRFKFFANLVAASCSACNRLARFGDVYIHVSQDLCFFAQRAVGRVQSGALAPCSSSLGSNCTTLGGGFPLRAP